MPGRDGTGPVGMGVMTGRGMGACGGYGTRFMCRTGRGAGLGLRGGFGGFAHEHNLKPEMKRELLVERRAFLENQLEFIKEQLEEL